MGYRLIPGARCGRNDREAKGERRGAWRGLGPSRSRGQRGGAGRSQRLLPTAPGKLWEASDRTTELNTDNRCWSLPPAYEGRHFPPHCRQQTRHWRQNGGRRGGYLEAGGGVRDVIALFPASRRSGRDGLGSAPRPPSGWARALSWGPDR